MYIQFICLLILGLLLLTLGVYFHRRFFKVKELISFPLNQEDKTIHFAKAGKYSIVLKGGLTIKNFFVILTSADNKQVDIFEPLFKYRAIRNSVPSVDYFNFQIQKVGDYGLKVHNPDKLSVKQIGPPKLASLIANDIPTTHLSLAVREQLSPAYFIFAVLSFIIGTFVILLDTVFLLYKLGIMVPTN